MKNKLFMCDVCLGSEPPRKKRKDFSERAAFFCAIKKRHRYKRINNCRDFKEVRSYV